MTKHQPTPRDAALVAIDIAKHRNEVLIELPGRGLARLPFFEHPAHQFGSTVRRQAGILVDVHSVLRESGCLSNFSFLAQGRLDNLSKDHT